jgi:hypothetical protein
MPSHKNLNIWFEILPDDNTGSALSHSPTAVRTVNTNRNPVLFNSSRREHPTRKGTGLKAYVSKKILNWHSLSLGLSADLCIFFYCLGELRQGSQRKIIQSSALRLNLRLSQFKISSDTSALNPTIYLYKKLNPISNIF